MHKSFLSTPCNIFLPHVPSLILNAYKATNLLFSETFEILLSSICHQFGSNKHFKTFLNMYSAIVRHGTQSISMKSNWYSCSNGPYASDFYLFTYSAQEREKSVKIASHEFGFFLFRLIYHKWGLKFIFYSAHLLP